jgi:hypothetical protein
MCVFQVNTPIPLTTTSYCDDAFTTYQFPGRFGKGCFWNTGTNKCEDVRLFDCDYDNVDDCLEVKSEGCFWNVWNENTEVGL